MIIIARANRRRQESIRHEIRIIMSKSQRENQWESVKGVINKAKPTQLIENFTFLWYNL